MAGLTAQPTRQILGHAGIVIVITKVLLLPLLLLLQQHAASV